MSQHRNWGQTPVFSEGRLPVHLRILEPLSGIIHELDREGTIDEVLLLQGMQPCIATGR